MEIEQHPPLYSMASFEGALYDKWLTYNTSKKGWVDGSSRIARDTTYSSASPVCLIIFSAGLAATLAKTGWYANPDS